MLNMGLELYRLTPLGLKRIPYYSEVNEPLFCYYVFCKKGALEKYNLRVCDVERKTGQNMSRIHLFG